MVSVPGCQVLKFTPLFLFFFFSFFLSLFIYYFIYFIHFFLSEFIYLLFYLLYSFLSFFLSLFIYFEREIGSWGGSERERESERERIPNRPHTASTEPYMGLELMNREIMT